MSDWMSGPSGDRDEPREEVDPHASDPLTPPAPPAPTPPPLPPTPPVPDPAPAPSPPAPPLPPLPSPPAPSSPPTVPPIPPVPPAPEPAPAPVPPVPQPVPEPVPPAPFDPSPRPWTDPPTQEPAPPAPSWMDQPVAAVALEPDVIEPDATEADVIETDVGPSDDAETPADPVALGDETIFELLGLSSEERRHLSMRLTGAGIAHRWEVGTDLVVATADADQIDFYIQEVQNPDGFADDELEAFDEDVDDEAVYAAMSNLYVAADRLMQRPADGSTINSFYDASDDVEGLPAPFGFDPRVWAQVLGLANSIADALDAEADSDAIGTDARTLRELLVNYV